MMKVYEIEVKETRSAKYTIEAESLAEAKKDAHWRLITQTRPPIEPKVSWTIKGEYHD